ncbi:MAG: phage tail tape measure protein, partial [Caldilineaceae bacterium]|nr:phage tail tape measure protein [Caldilineaceae bacterium]
MKASQSDIKKAFDSHAKLADKAADATGKLKVAQAGYQDLLEKGVKSGQRFERAKQQIEKATRDEVRATRQATDSWQEYQVAQRRAADGTAAFARSGGQMQSAFSGIGKRAGSAFVGAFSGLLLAGGMMNAAQAAGRQVVDAFQSVIESGMNFERTMNTFRGVTRASDADMRAMGDAARALGSDTALAGVSATDAAQAMTELAKGGFNVQDAIEGARGTLQLATAAQLDAAEAATIQTNAINVFRLGVEDAAHVADVFANAAIASSLEIPDLSLALQQAGSVAQGFGISFEDTVATLATFAQMGVKGSDAGTLMKTSLQSLLNPTEKQSTAMQELDLRLHDVNGQFVGYRELLGQLTEASKGMTQEQFNTATALIFGSDAMRAAMFTTADGAEVWDQMRTALDRTGAAADMAGAQMRGLPGVVEGVSNSLEGMKLSIYDALTPLAEELGPKVVDAFDEMGQWISANKPEIIEF